MTSERIFGSGSGRSHIGVRIDRLQTLGVVGVMMLDVSPGMYVCMYVCTYRQITNGGCGWSDDA